MTEYEMLEAYIATSDSIYANIEFWLTVTFGVILISDFPNIRLSRTMSRLILVLYGFLSLLFIVRLYTTGALNDGLRNDIINSGSSLLLVNELTNNLFAVLSLVTMILGTIGTIILVAKVNKSKYKNKE